MTGEFHGTSTASSRGVNKATRTITAILGCTFAIAGLHHGFFETLQGNTPTNSFLIQSIGPSQLMWEYGTDDAFTVIPNFLTTGIAAIIISLFIVVWSVRFVPGVPDPDTVLMICWMCLLASLILINVAYISGFAHDLKGGKPASA